jgi:hypothetical protein
LPSVARRIAVAVTGGALAIAITITTAGTASSETAVGAGAGVAVGNNVLDVGFLQTLQSTLDSQFIGVDVAMVNGRLVLTGFATPGVHSAVLAVVANALNTRIPVPVAVGVITPNLGLDLGFLAAGAGIEIPDLGGLIAALGIVDRVQIIR